MSDIYDFMERMRLKRAERYRLERMQKRIDEANGWRKEWPKEPGADVLMDWARSECLNVDAAAAAAGKTAAEILTAIWDEGVNRQFVHYVAREQKITLEQGFREVAAEVAAELPKGEPR